MGAAGIVADVLLWRVEMGLKIENDKTDEPTSESDGETKEERLRKIRAISSKLPPAPPGVTSDHSDLYDENGLPI